MHWIPVGASLYSTDLGSSAFVGSAGSAAKSGLQLAGFGLNAVYALILLGWLFVPVYVSAGIFTIPEYMKERFGRERIRSTLAVISLLNDIIKLSLILYAGGLFLSQAINKSDPKWMYISIVALLILSSLFAFFGGLRAVIWTDLVQTIIMFTGAYILAGMALYEVGGLQGLRRQYPLAIASSADGNSSCSLPAKNAFSILAPLDSDMPWPTAFGMLVLSLWYWCSDQVIVQRALAAKNVSHAKGGCVLAGLLKTQFVIMGIIPGMAARVLYTDRVACASPEACLAVCGKKSGCFDIAFSELIFNLMPAGLRGLMVAVIMAALLTSLTSIFNSAATVFVIDIWKRIRSTASDFEMLIMGRIIIVVLTGLSFLWIPFMLNSTDEGLLIYGQRVISHIAPPICAVYCLAIFWPRTNESGVFWGLVIGMVIGVTRFGIFTAFPGPACGADDTRPEIIRILIGNVHFLYFAIISWVLTGVSTIAISLLTPPMGKETLPRLTYATRHSTELRLSPDESTRKINTVQKKTEPQTGLMWRLANICGGAKQPEDDSIEEKETTKQEDEIADAQKFLYESKSARRWTTVGLVASVFVCTFVYGFFT